MKRTAHTWNTDLIVCLHSKSELLSQVSARAFQYWESFSGKRPGTVSLQGTCFDLFFFFILSSNERAHSKRVPISFIFIYSTCLPQLERECSIPFPGQMQFKVKLENPTGKLTAIMRLPDTSAIENAFQRANPMSIRLVKYSARMRNHY